MYTLLTIAQRSLFYALLVIQSATISIFAADWNLIWSEEFTIDGLVDTTRWHFETGTGANGWGNNELQYYTNRLDNAYIRNGNLEITVRRQDTAGKNFTSARMTTGYGRFSFQYGKVEARMKVLKGKGMWPAFWMMGESIASTPWPGCGEIDIMEVMSSGGALDDNIVLSTAHWLYDADNTHAQYGLSDTSAAPLADSFHVYGITWDRKYLGAFLDGRRFWEIDITPSHLSELHQPFYLLLNAAVGGTPLGISNPGEVTATLPQTMLVDYIRVYQDSGSADNLKECGAATNATVMLRHHGRVLASIPIRESDPAFPLTLSIYTLNGKKVLRQRLPDLPAVRDIELPGGLAIGIYCAAIETGTRIMYYRFFQ
jgi:beta-glucanase (GH16 family)